MRTTLTGLAAAALALVVLTACVDATPIPDPVGSSPALPSTGPTNPVDDGDVVAPPEVSVDGGVDALEAAERALATFAQPDLSADAWWTQMVPLLSQAAAIAYESTDPSQIPVRHVTGAGRILEGSTDISLIVQVQTDVGLYNVTLIRGSDTEPWLADRIRPAQA